MSSNKQKEQLKLKLNEPFSNRFIKTKKEVNKFFTILEINSALKVFYFWAFVITSTLLFSVQINELLENVQNIPSKISLFAYQIDLSNKLISSNHLIIIPIVGIVITLVTVYIYFKIFFVNKFLSFFTVLNCFLVNTILTILILKIISFYNG